MTALSPSSCYYKSEQPMTDAQATDLFNYATNDSITAKKIQDIVPTLIDSIAESIANYAGIIGKLGFLEWNVARKIIWLEKKERLPSTPCAPPPQLIQILQSELSLEETAYFGKKEDGARYCVSDMYQLVWLNKEELKARIEKLTRILQENPNYNHAALLKDLIEKMNYQLSMEQKEGWALISKIPLPGSENLNSEEIREALQRLDCESPSSLLVYTMILDNALSYPFYKLDLPVFKTKAIARGQIDMDDPDGLGRIRHETTFPEVISLVNNRLEKYSTIQTGTLVVRRWNLAAPL